MNWTPIPGAPHPRVQGRPGVPLTTAQAEERSTTNWGPLSCLSQNHTALLPFPTGSPGPASQLASPPPPPLLWSQRDHPHMSSALNPSRAPPHPRDHVQTPPLHGKLFQATRAQPEASPPPRPDPTPHLCTGFCCLEFPLLGLSSPATLLRPLQDAAQDLLWAAFPDSPALRCTPESPVATCVRTQ